MAVQKPQTAWDVLAKMVRTAVRTRFETKGCGSKQKENERFAWDLLTKMIRTAYRTKGMAVQKPQTALDILAKWVRTAIRTRFESKECCSKQNENERFSLDFLQE